MIVSISTEITGHASVCFEMGTNHFTANHQGFVVKAVVQVVLNLLIHYLAKRLVRRLIPL